jgi:hypothetical protein
VVQPIPRAPDGTGGISIIQDGGIQEGGRVIRGSVTAADRATAEAWARRHRAMLVGPYYLPERWSTDFEFVPRVDGVAVDGLNGQGSTSNVRVHRVDFTFAEILNNAPPT